MKSAEFYRTRTWKLFTKYQLLKWSNNSVVFCWTCGKPMLITDKGCCTGHLIKVFDGNRSNFSTAFEECNSGPQCNHCNTYGGGRPDVMARRLIEKYGPAAIDKLYIKKNHPMKLDRFTLDLIYDEIKPKFDLLVKEKGNPWKVK